MSILDAFPRLVDEVTKVPKASMVISYGTSGFRENAEHLNSILHRMGMLAVLRSRSLGKVSVFFKWKMEE